jgi:hypothetical protein
MSPQSRLVAGIVLIIVPTVEIGGASILSLLITDPAYAQNDLRQDLWRARATRPRGRVARALLGGSTLRGRGYPL